MATATRNAKHPTIALTFVYSNHVVVFSIRMNDETTGMLLALRFALRLTLHLRLKVGWVTPKVAGRSFSTRTGNYREALHGVKLHNRIGRRKECGGSMVQTKRYSRQPLLETAWLPLTFMNFYCHTKNITKTCTYGWMHTSCRWMGGPTLCGDFTLYGDCTGFYHCRDGSPCHSFHAQTGKGMMLDWDPCTSIVTLLFTLVQSLLMCTRYSSILPRSSRYSNLEAALKPLLQLGMAHSIALNPTQSNKNFAFVYALALLLIQLRIITTPHACCQG